MRTVALYEMLLGIITLAGGIYGFAEVSGTISLVGGIVAGLILIVSGFSMQKGSRRGLFTCLVVTLLLLVFFGRQFFFTGGTFMPAGLMAILSIISLLSLVLLLVQPTERKRIF